MEFSWTISEASNKQLKESETDCDLKNNSLDILIKTLGYLQLTFRRKQKVGFSSFPHLSERAFETKNVPDKF